MDDLQQARDLVARLQSFVSDTAVQGKILQRAGHVAGAKMEEFAREYPPPSGKPLELWYTRTDKDGRAYKSKFKTMRQQRKVFALIRAGAVPYRRSLLLGRSLTHEVTVINGGVRVEVGTNIPYARYVIGEPPDQSHYHQGHWTPLATLIAQHQDEIARAFSYELLTAVKAYLKSGRP